MIRKYRHQINRPLASRGTKRIRRMIGGRPRICTVGHAAIGQLVEYALVGMCL